MKKEVIFSIKSPYRQPMDIIGFKFGGGEKTVCIIGSLRGNEIQQMYICSQLIQRLTVLEKEGKIEEGKEILVIPCVNYYSMNIQKRFWTMDNTDINRMFPGYDQGETTQRIADGLFDKIKDYQYGVQLTSFYQPGYFMPHVKMMDTGFEDKSLLKLFGLPYGLVRSPRPYDTTTLNYNLQVWNVKAVSLFTNETSRVNHDSMKMVVTALIRFLSNIYALNCPVLPGYQTEIIRESDIVQIQCQTGGLFQPVVKVGETVRKGDLLANILDPLEGNVLSEVRSETDGVVFYEYQQPLLVEHTIIFKVISLE